MNANVVANVHRGIVTGWCVCCDDGGSALVYYSYDFCKFGAKLSLGAVSEHAVDDKLKVLMQKERCLLSFFGDCLKVGECATCLLKIIKGELSFVLEFAFWSEAEDGAMNPCLQKMLGKYKPIAAVVPAAYKNGNGFCAMADRVFDYFALNKLE